MTAMLAMFERPFGPTGPSAVSRLRKIGNEYVVEKVIEDEAGEKLPGTTTAIHDAKTGRLFLSSKFCLSKRFFCVLSVVSG